jgi:hypothetical protein
LLLNLQTIIIYAIINFFGGNVKPNFITTFFETFSMFQKTFNLETSWFLILIQRFRTFQNFTPKVNILKNLEGFFLALAHFSFTLGNSFEILACF